MDEVLEKLQTTVVSQNENGNKKNEFESLYKYSGRLGGQEERRREILEIQKNNRRDKLDKHRGILELVSVVEEENVFKSQNKAQYRPKIHVPGFNQAFPTYNNVLMLSEWMVEKPMDFNENWYVTPCPKGARMLVIAYQGITKCYSKYGKFRFQFRSELPGGCPSTSCTKKCCVLDCFYDQERNTMYILDLLAWSNQPMTDCETEFRHYWLETKVSEIPGLKVISEQNTTLFSLLPKVSCTPDLLNNLMQTYPIFPDNKPEIDGLLFYHKGAHYVAGETPLVGWLYPYMVQEVLGDEIRVHEEFLAARPADYVNQSDFIEKFQENLQNKRKSRIPANVAMDTTEITQIETQTLEYQGIPQNMEPTIQGMESEEIIYSNDNCPLCYGMEAIPLVVTHVPGFYLQY
ncbi:snurportin-1 [Aphomia sociella]